MFRKILFPIKFDEFSLDLLKCIFEFKRIGMEEIILLHVIDVSRLTLDKYEGYSEEELEVLKALVEEKIKSAVKMVEDAGFIAKKIIRVGIPYREILKFAEEEKDISLIVSGRQKKSLLKEIFIGSNTEKIIRYGNLPVFVPKYPAVFGGSKEESDKICKNIFKRILYPTDWSAYALATLQYLKKLKGAPIEEIVVVHIMDEKAMKLQPFEKFKEFEREDIDRLEKTRKELEELGFKVKTRLEVGNPRSDLIKISQEEDITMIIIGTHGKGYVKNILWGSVSRNLVEYSDRPVLIICNKSLNYH